MVAKHGKSSAPCLTRRSKNSFLIPRPLGGDSVIKSMLPSYVLCSTGSLSTESSSKSESIGGSWVLLICWLFPGGESGNNESSFSGCSNDGGGVSLPEVLVLLVVGVLFDLPEAKSAESMVAVLSSNAHSLSIPPCFHDLMGRFLDCTTKIQFPRSAVELVTCFQKNEKQAPKIPNLFSLLHFW